MAYRRPYKENVPVQFIVKFITELIIVISIAWLVVMNTCSRAIVVGNSMDGLFCDGQTVLINKIAYLYEMPKRYDIIYFRPEGINSSRTYIKRIIGLPGETVQIVSGEILINGMPLSDDINDDMILSAGLAAEKITLGEDEYFVLGDNRNNSEDSRFAAVGNISFDSIIGRPWLIASPIQQIQFVGRNDVGITPADEEQTE